MSKKFGSALDISSILNVESLKEIDRERASVVKKIPLDKLDDFPEHPFRVVEDAALEELTESIREAGDVLNPIIVREVNGRYQKIAGHRRTLAARRAGLSEISALIKPYTDEEAAIVMVDTNLHREKILPSEKAFAYKIKMDAMKKQGKRTDLTSAPLVQKLAENTTRAAIASENGDSREQVRRYIRLTYLIKPLLDMVDSEALPFRTAVELSYLSEGEQELIRQEPSVPSLKQAELMRKSERELTRDDVRAILRGEDPFAPPPAPAPIITRASEPRPVAIRIEGEPTVSFVPEPKPEAQPKPEAPVEDITELLRRKLELTAEGEKASDPIRNDAEYKRAVSALERSLSDVLALIPNRWSEEDVKNFEHSATLLKVMIWRNGK
jgi:ParB family chromosome partitioning protein